MASQEIGILLGVYNGADFLDEQIQSYLGQGHGVWQILARDDASTDSSLEILNRYAQKDSRIHILPYKGSNLGVVGNFSALMKAALETDMPYFAFSDQDDVWHPDKLSALLGVMKEAETICPGKPVLVHSDAEVVDTHLNTVCPSFMGYQGICHNRVNPLNNLLVQNFVTGCTLMVNRKLLEMACPVPEAALMHDWWLALCAAVSGCIAFTDQPLIRYRQHRNNQVGAKSVTRYL
ncbi:MAG: glycosyltransferase family 2 protein, partial [Proteobacteria bacterium]|nr:glycosyltransferase family 2 protein [Pseudomonadota bacterium]